MRGRHAHELFDHVRIDHAYELRRGSDVLAEAATTIACVGRDGHVPHIPDYLAGT